MRISEPIARATSSGVDTVWPEWFLEKATRNRAGTSAFGTAHNEDTNRVALVIADDKGRVSSFELSQDDAERLIEMLRYSLQGFGS